MNDRKIVIILLLSILIIVVLLFNFYGANKTYSYSFSDDKSIAVMVYNSTANNYVAQDSIPTGNYILNTTLSYCDSGGVISSYDNVNGTVLSSLVGTDKCHYYFDEKLYPFLSEKIIEGLSGTHNSYAYSIVNEGGGLRYEGRDPANYVCFEESCTDDTLYRILGSFAIMVDTTGNGTVDKTQTVVKIIKSKSLSTKMKWDSNGSNSWSSASLKTYLNNTWDKPTSYIITARWNLGGYSDTKTTTETFLSAESSGTTWDGKVGLMYVSDYGYAVRSSDCSRSKNLSSYYTNSCYANDWLYYGSESLSPNYTWFITPYSEDTSNTFYIYSNGQIRYNLVTGSIGVRPAFYIPSNVSVTSGTGTASDPYIIE